MEIQSLKQWRQVNGITQTELAEKLGVQQRTVSAIEDGGNTDFENLRLIYAITEGAVCPNLMILGHK